MSQDPFKPIDESLMKIFKSRREKQIPPRLMQGFAASVETRIRQKENPEPNPVSQRVLWPQWTPVLAVLIIAVALVTKLPLSNRSAHPSVSPARMVIMANVSSSLADEIEVLSDLGVWTDEDENNL